MIIMIACTAICWTITGKAFVVLDRRQKVPSLSEIFLVAIPACAVAASAYVSGWLFLISAVFNISIPITVFLTVVLFLVIGLFLIAAFLPVFWRTK